MGKTFRYASPYGQTYDLALSVAQYACNGNTAIKAEYFDKEFDAFLPFASVTVNLDEKLPEGYGFVDTNNFRGALEWLTENGLADFTGQYGFSGFCQYPLVRFNMGLIG